MLTIDASVWVSAVTPFEKESAASLALIEYAKGKNVRVIVPTLLRAEFAGAISRGRNDPLLARQLSDSLIPLTFLTWIPIEDTVTSVAVDLASKNRLRGADAIYAAVALMNRCTLVSLDQEHLTRLKDVVPVLTPTGALQVLVSEA